MSKANIPFEQVFAEAMADPETRAHYDKLQPAKEIVGHRPPGEPRVGKMHTRVWFGEASVDLPLLSEQEQAELRTFLVEVYEAGKRTKEVER